ncbi:TPA_asm: hypothetical protein G0G78_13710 [Salmonella enterica]|nr:hypothetical protein [Salmonella enterica]EAO7618447.1 hypothetical protein [Salmonella enterica]EAQ6819196.1 hypothetical protein [Salmonella enterica]EAW9499495.1 hypothetical protein [Salmonella enterica]EBT2375725.1 hypothetical protein [Salmonella enterica]
MKIEYQDAGMEARLIITGTIFSVRKHNNLVDRMLMRIPQLREESKGFFIQTTCIYGCVADVLLAEEIAKEHGYVVKTG